MKFTLLKACRQQYEGQRVNIKLLDGGDWLFGS